MRGDQQFINFFYPKAHPNSDTQHDIPSRIGRLTLFQAAQVSYIYVASEAEILEGQTAFLPLLSKELEKCGG